ncbi:MAG: L-threonylcarbamoyladenylate synthase [Emergencia sp.]
METKIFKDTEDEIKQAAQIIADGGLVAFPTETVYGLGADALNPEAVGKVYAAKGRPSDNPMIVHIAREEDLSKLTDTVTPDMEALMDVFWPGPLTMIVRRKPVVPDVTTGGLDTVGVRMPSNEVALALIEESGCPIAAPSANLSGKPSPTSAEHVIEDLDGRVDAIIVSDDCEFGIESTVVDMTGDEPMILRPGMITSRDIEAILHKPVALDPTLNRRPDELKEEGRDFHPKAPGMKYRHYAPKAHMTIYEGDDREAVFAAIDMDRAEREALGEKVVVINYDSEHPEKAAKHFFAELRAADKHGADAILAAAIEEKGVGFSVMNRMLKSAGYNIKKVEKEVDKMIIALASDHGGFRLKEQIKEHLEARGLDTKDLGTHSEDSVDYPIFGQKCGETVASGEADLGIVVCGTGIGISIAANKVKGVRCGLCTSVEMATLTKQHNNANILALGGRTTAPELAMEIVDAWLDTEFEGGRHQRRVDMLDNM